MRGKTGKIAIFGFYEIIEYGCDSGGTGAANFEGNTGSKQIVTQAVGGINDESFSMSLWVQRRRVAVFEYLLSMGAQAARAAVYLFFGTSDNTMAFNLHGDTMYTASSYPDDTGVWVHWSFVFNKVGNTMVIFRNGISQSPQAGTPGSSPNGGVSGGTTTATGAIHLGVYKWSTSAAPFNGNLDEFRLFEGRALAPADVLTISQASVSDNNLEGLTVSLSFDTLGSLTTDYSCGGSNDAASATDVVAVRGVVCGSVSAVSLACDNR